MIRPTRLVASAAATTLAASGLALVAAAPASAATAPVLTWEISQQFDDHLSSHVLADGATETAEGVVTFPNGVGSYDPATGAASVAYDGSVAGSFVFGAGPLAQTYYTVTFADPVVTVDADGDGVVTAVVSASNAAGMGNEAAETEPKRVKLTTFEAPEWTAVDGLASITATPAWAGTLAAGSAEATALGIPEGQPVDGKSWHPELLAQLTPGVRPHFYASGSGSDAKKAPAPFTAQATGAQTASPQVSYRTVSASPANGLTLAVSGTGFNGRTNPGDNGVYVGLAPAGGLPETDDMGDQSKFAAAAWVSAAQITGGAFTTSLTAPTEKLDRGTSYALYTWQAHTHSNTTQDTETPVAIDWSQLEPATPAKARPAAKVTVTKKPTTSRAGKVKASYTGTRGAVTGTVTVTVKKAGRTVATRTATLARGTAVLGLPKLARGDYRVKVVYAGSRTYQRVARTVPLEVTR